MSNRLIDFGTPEAGKPLTVGKVTVQYLQDADTNSHELQSLELTTEDSGIGAYYILKTERWAIDNIQELIDVLKDFESRI